MADLSSILAAHRAAADDLLVTASRAGMSWSDARAAGKWSPAQIVEHVARSLEESANVVAGAPSKFPTFPAFVRPIVRGVFFNRVLRNGAFPKARTTKAFDPATGPTTPAEGRQRLDGALAKFDQACRTRAASGQQVSSTLFGQVSVTDFARFLEVHTRHHCAQLAS